MTSLGMFPLRSLDVSGGRGVGGDLGSPNSPGGRRPHSGLSDPVLAQVDSTLFTNQHTCISGVPGLSEDAEEGGGSSL